MEEVPAGQLPEGASALGRGSAPPLLPPHLSHSAGAQDRGGALESSARRCGRPPLCGFSPAPPPSAAATKTPCRLVSAPGTTKYLLKRELLDLKGIEISKGRGTRARKSGGRWAGKEGGPCRAWGVGSGAAVGGTRWIREAGTRSLPPQPWSAHLCRSSPASPTPTPQARGPTLTRKSTGRKAAERAG